MSQIVTNIGGLSIPKKLEKGANIITKSTNNPEVPGNGPALTAFSAPQAGQMPPSTPRAVRSSFSS